ncbi:MAG: DUF1737 domain-containing protein [Anaerolineae bacterium]|nr:DUF1737 domain-containing protein [Anaerolineae bacterium]
MNRLRYKILTASSVGELVDQVNDALAEGWSPLGPPQISIIEDHTGDWPIRETFCFQTVVAPEIQTGEVF